MKNYGILNYDKVDVDNFTSENGLKIRRKLNPLLREIFKIATKGDIIVDNYPKLEDDKPYIFVATHNFVEDTISTLATIDRNAYLLFGTTNQLKVNPEMYAAWANGFIYVDRKDEKNRKDALLKMKKVLESGSSVLIFPEGGFNNTENLLCQRLFASPYILSKATGCEVVPIAPYNEFGKKEIYMNAGNPINLGAYEDKNESLTYLRDELATLLYENLENHAPHIKRSDLGDNPRLDYMEERKNEYLKTRWTEDVWDEELTIYRDHVEREFDSIDEDLKNVHIDKNNAYVMAPVLSRIQTKEKYDFKSYMHENWNKNVR